MLFTNIDELLTLVSDYLESHIRDHDYVNINEVLSWIKDCFNFRNVKIPCNGLYVRFHSNDDPIIKITLHKTKTLVEIIRVNYKYFCIYQTNQFGSRMDLT